MQLSVRISGDGLQVILESTGVHRNRALAQAPGQRESWHGPGLLTPASPLASTGSIPNHRDF